MCGTSGRSSSSTSSFGVHRPVRVFRNTGVERSLRGNLNVATANNTVQQKRSIPSDLNPQKVARSVMWGASPDEPRSLGESRGLEVTESSCHPAQVRASRRSSSVQLVGTLRTRQAAVTPGVTEHVPGLQRRPS